jgi:hypothetical protein
MSELQDCFYQKSKILGEHEITVGFFLKKNASYVHGGVNKTLSKTLIILRKK